MTQNHDHSHAYLAGKYIACLGDTKQWRIASYELNPTCNPLENSLQTRDIKIIASPKGCVRLYKSLMQTNGEPTFQWKTLYRLQFIIGN